MAVSIIYKGSISGTTDSSGNLSLSSVSIGTASNDRIVFVCVDSYNGNAQDWSGVTIGGVSATEAIVDISSSNDAFSIWWARVTSGTTATIAFSGGVASKTVVGAVYAVTGAYPWTGGSPVSATQFNDQGGTSASLTISVPTNGGAIAAAHGTTSGTANWAWTGSSSDLPNTQQGTTGRYFMTASNVNLAGNNSISETPQGRLIAVAIMPGTGTVNVVGFNMPMLGM